MLRFWVYKQLKLYKILQARWCLMGRKVLAVVVAVVVAAAIFFVVQMVAAMFPAFAPRNLEYMSADERRAYVSSMPLGAYLTIAFGVLLASVAAGWIVTNVAKATHSITLPIVVAALLALSGVVWFLGYVPGQPWWLIVFAIVLCFPFALLGHRFARRW